MYLWLVSKKLWEFLLQNETDFDKKFEFLVVLLWCKRFLSFFEVPLFKEPKRSNRITKKPKIDYIKLLQQNYFRIKYQFVGKRINVILPGQWTQWCCNLKNLIPRNIPKIFDFIGHDSESFMS